MTGNFVQNFKPFIYTAQTMLEMQEDLKLKKGFKVTALTIVTSRFPRHYELHVETDDKKHFVQLLEEQGQTDLISCSPFTPILPPGELK